MPFYQKRLIIKEVVTYPITRYAWKLKLPVHWAGLRGFELDVLVDNPQGGKYAYSAGLKLAGQSNTLISPDLLKPGLKVTTLFHPRSSHSCCHG